jgi:cell division protein FtsB
MRWARSSSLAALLWLVQGDLWFGKGNCPTWPACSAPERAAGRQRPGRARNARLAAEVSDLKEGLEMVEEKARAELGMVRPDEILVQVTK